MKTIKQNLHPCSLCEVLWMSGTNLVSSVVIWLWMLLTLLRSVEACRMIQNNYTQYPIQGIPIQGINPEALLSKLLHKGCIQYKESLHKAWTLKHFGIFLVLDTGCRRKEEGFLNSPSLLCTHATLIRTLSAPKMDSPLTGQRCYISQPQKAKQNCMHALLVQH